MRGSRPAAWGAGREIQRLCAQAVGRGSSPSGRVEVVGPCLQTVGVADDVAARVADGAGPARAGLLLGDRVEAFAVDHHERVFGVGVDRYVLAWTGFAVGLEFGGVLGRAEQPPAVQRAGDGGGAVVAG